MAATATTATIAEALGTTPRELRKFLRSEARNVGKGARYELPAGKREVTAMAKRFTAWSEAKAAKVDEGNPNDTGHDTDTDATPEELEGDTE